MSACVHVTYTVPGYVGCFASKVNISAAVLQDLLKHTPTGHPDHPLLQDALRISQNFLSSINEETTPRRQSVTVKKGEVSIHTGHTPTTQWPHTRHTPATHRPHTGNTVPADLLTNRMVKSSSRQKVLLQRLHYSLFLMYFKLPYRTSACDSYRLYVTASWLTGDSNCRCFNQLCLITKMSSQTYFSV